MKNARRFHNDAVRDTLALRERPMVRLLRLGGHAPLPVYFEIAERMSERAPEGDAPSSRTCRACVWATLIERPWGAWSRV